MEGAAFRAEGFGGRKGAGEDGGERKGQRQHGYAQLLVRQLDVGPRRGCVRGLSKKWTESGGQPGRRAAGNVEPRRLRHEDEQRDAQ
jgi:hypothetical protein